MAARTARPTLVEPALVVILAGVCAALHVGKLAPAIPVLQAALSVSLVQAGFLLSMVQLAGMTAGVVFGALADGLEPRRSMLLGLSLLALASALGGAAQSVPWLMALRALEGFGFLLVVLGAPSLIRALVAPQRLDLVMALWGAYMPLAATLALLTGPGVMALFGQAFGWRAWWWGLAALCAAMAVWLARAVPAATQKPSQSSRSSQPAQTASSVRSPLPALSALVTRLARTLSSPGPWWLAMAFAVYSGPWLAVIGFMPTVYAQGGTPLATAGLFTAAAAAVNMAGNVAAGRLLHAGVAPVRLLVAGYAAMGLCAAAAFMVLPGAAGVPQPVLPPAARLAALLLFSGVGGLVPATLFALAVRVAPGEGLLSSTVGWIQQWSALGQFAVPPLVAWVAARAGGWHLTGWLAGLCSLAGLALGAAISRHLGGLAPRR